MVASGPSGICAWALWAMVPVAVLALAGCSSQDFGRPVGRFADIADSGQSYASTNDDQEVRARTERLAKALLVWDQQKSTVDKDYTVGPDDMLEVGILALEEPGRVTKVDRPVGKGGTISLPLVGETQAMGLSTREIEKIVAARYDGKYLKDPQVTVRVSDYRSSPVVVSGMVGKPGTYYLKHNESSVLEMLSEAGGVTASAGDVLLVIRRKKPDEALPASFPSNGVHAVGTATNAVAPPAPSRSGEGQLAGGVVHQTASNATPVASVPTNTESVCANDAVAVAAADETCSNVTATVAMSPEPKKPSFWRRLFGRHSSGETKSGGTAESTNSSPPVAETPAAAVAGTNRTESIPAESHASDAAASDIVSVDLRQLLDDGDTRLNLPVRGGDVISVPPGKRQFVYVMGYVHSPGAVELRGRKELDAVQAVAMAGGLSTSARAQNSQLIRETPNGRNVVQVDLTKIVRGVRPPLYMLPGDTLIVGSSFWAKLLELIKPTASVGASVSPVP